MGHPRGWKRRAHEYTLIAQHRQADTRALFTHYIAKVTKKPGLLEKTSAKHKNAWFIKHEKDIDVAQREVYAQEVFRLLISNHPKTRFALSSDGKMKYVLSKAVPEYTSLSDFVAHIGGYTKLNQFFLDSADKKPGEHRLKGLGRLMVVAILVNEVDFKLGNIGKDKDGDLVKIDGDWCFAGLRDQFRFADVHFTSHLLKSLPYCSDYNAHNWLDQVQNDVVNAAAVLIGGGAMNEFRNEVNETLLRILMMPKEMFIKLAFHHQQADNAEKSLKILLRIKKEMEFAALTNESFRVYIQSSDVQKQLHGYIDYVNDFTMSGDDYLIDNQDIFEIESINRLNDIRNKVNEPVKYLEGHAKSGDMVAQFELANAYSQGLVDNKPNYAQAVYWLEQAGNQGLIIAQESLIDYYEHGVGVAVNMDKVDFLKNSVSAHKGNAESQYKLALNYYHGKGVLQDDTKAADWCVQAVSRNYIPAERFYALLCQEGIGVPQDTAKANFWLTHANAMDDNIDAQYELAILFEHGMGIVASDKDAFYWCLLAARQDHIPAQELLATYYRNGTGVVQDNERADYWGNLAEAAKGDVNKQYQLGLQYLSGSGVKKDSQSALKWLEQAGNGGLPEAQYKLFEIYFQGSFGAVNKAKARVWLKKASDQAYPDAVKKLKELDSNMWVSMPLFKTSPARTSSSHSVSSSDHGSKKTHK